MTIIAIGLGLAWFSAAISVDRIFASRAPDVALSWGLGGATASAIQAGRLAEPGASPTRLNEAEQLGRDALGREPVSVPAARALGQVAGLRNDLPRADRLFAYSESLSRRDLLTQMWQIEASVRRDDVAGALKHYDRALRTQRRARPILFPVMVTAATDPAVATAMMPLVAHRVQWVPDFLGVLARADQASPEALGRLLVSARLRPGVPAEREALDAGLARLVNDGRYEAAFAVYSGAVGDRSRGLVRNGGFEALPDLAPFDWTFADEADISASQEPVGSGMTLILRTASGRSGELARQLLILPPGRYRLGVTSSGASADPITRAAISIRCASSDRGLLLMALSAVEEARLSASFDVPAGCRAQHLTITAPTGLGEAGGGVAIDNLVIEPLRG